MEVATSPYQSMYLALLSVDCSFFCCQCMIRRASTGSSASPPHPTRSCGPVVGPAHLAGARDNPFQTRPRWKAVASLVPGHVSLLVGEFARSGLWIVGPVNTGAALRSSGHCCAQVSAEISGGDGAACASSPQPVCHLLKLVSGPLLHRPAVLPCLRLW